MRRGGYYILPLAAALLPATLSPAQNLHVRIAYPKTIPTMPPAVVWLKPLQPVDPPPDAPQKTYTLLQKNRSFVPHLLVVPVGANVAFPNEDPFYHNVFSLFDGKRFDLGLYEAGSKKTVTFSREGISYIFCNIHPEMSAVVITLATPFFAIVDQRGSAELRDVPPGDYELHIWAEGIPQPVLNRLPRKVHISGERDDLGVVTIPVTPARAGSHLNEFGQPYDHPSNSPY